MTLEEMCRRLLRQAMKDGLVAITIPKEGISHLGEFSSGDLAGMANLQAKFLDEEVQERFPRHAESEGYRWILVQPDMAQIWEFGEMLRGGMRKTRATVFISTGGSWRWQCDGKGGNVETRAEAMSACEKALGIGG